MLINPRVGRNRPTPCWVGVGEARNGHNSFHGQRASALNTPALCPHNLAPAHGPGAACPRRGYLVILCLSHQLQFLLSFSWIQTLDGKDLVDA